MLHVYKLNRFLENDTFPKLFTMIFSNRGVALSFLKACSQIYFVKLGLLLLLFFHSPVFVAPVSKETVTTTLRKRP